MRMSIIRKQIFVGIAASSLFAVGCKQAPTTEQPAKPAPSPFAVAEPTDMGGQKIVKLVRKPTSNGTKPEFVQRHYPMPGRGMNLFQITANIPGKGEVEVFTAPSLARRSIDPQRQRSRFLRQQELLARWCLPGSLPQPHSRHPLTR